MKNREFDADLEYMNIKLLALILMKIDEDKNMEKLNNYSKNNYLLVELII